MKVNKIANFSVDIELDAEQQQEIVEGVLHEAFDIPTNAYINNEGILVDVVEKHGSHPWIEEEKHGSHTWTDEERIRIATPSDKLFFKFLSLFYQKMEKLYPEKDE